MTTYLQMVKMSLILAITAVSIMIILINRVTLRLHTSILWIRPSYYDGFSLYILIGYHLLAYLLLYAFPNNRSSILNSIYFNSTNNHHSTTWYNITLGRL
ncbi:hypothetical protein K502DRAFT_350104 [Neoconidiobolus thromboides FSU 785]|nr:hypothetical protein K502DRAFT_350104 [Neoconidiobolus thromboides FSU 785]